MKSAFMMCALQLFFACGYLLIASAYVNYIS